MEKEEVISRSRHKAMIVVVFIIIMLIFVIAVATPLFRIGLGPAVVTIILLLAVPTYYWLSDLQTAKDIVRFVVDEPEKEEK